MPPVKKTAKKRAPAKKAARKTAKKTAKKRAGKSQSRAGKTERASTKVKKKLMIEAMRNNLCVISLAAKAVGINRKSHQRWMKDDPNYKEQIEELDEYALDFVESKHFKKINDGNSKHILFHLRTKGKKRGYGESMEHTGSDGGPIKTMHFHYPEYDPNEPE